MAVSRAKTVAKKNRINQMMLDEASPEKAGVGGSIPSLATTFSITYGHPLVRFCSNSKNSGSPEFVSIRNGSR
jgi:hypothetical protein